MPKCASTEHTIPVHKHLFTGDKRLQIALVGLANSGKTTIFEDVSSTFVQGGNISGQNRHYQACNVKVGLDEVHLIDLPDIDCLQHFREQDTAALHYLLWGNTRPPALIEDDDAPDAVPFSPPDLIIQVVDATDLQRHLELSLELVQLGRPMVIALNRMDEARKKNLIINIKSLSALLRVPVVPTTATTGHGLWELFNTAVKTIRKQTLPLSRPLEQHLQKPLRNISKTLSAAKLHNAFRLPQAFLLQQIAAGNYFFLSQIENHFPELLSTLKHQRRKAEQKLQRPLSEALHADRHHLAATLYERVTHIGGPYIKRDWRYWLDELFLAPHWGLIGSLTIFAAILFVVFEVSAFLDALAIAPLFDLAEQWQPSSVYGVVGRAVIDGIIGMMGIVIPYMLPLVSLLVALEKAGIMQRIAFVLDRSFHHIGLRGGTAASFLLGLGCNVPAISSVASAAKGHERIVASFLITFVPCSARSSIILAIAGKYLGGIGVFVIFISTLLVIAILGRLLNQRKIKSTPGLVQSIPAFSRPQWKAVAYETWSRSRDIITVVTPLLIVGSVVLALLQYAGTNHTINLLLTPITQWWLGLPVALGVPILFGVLRKELSLLMIYQALGTFNIDNHMNWIQISTFLVFLTFYVPCLSTFAAMLKTIGQKFASYSLAFSIAVALVISGFVRLVLLAAETIII